MLQIKKFVFLFFFIQLHIPIISLNYTVFNQKYENMKGRFSMNKNGDLILEYSAHNSRIFYGIKKDGKGFFNGEYIKIIDDIGGNRYEGVNSFVSLNNTDSYSQYLISFAAYDSIVELYDIEKDISNSENYVNKSTVEVLGNQINSYVSSLIELNNDKNEYILFYIYDGKYIIQKFAISQLSLDNILIKKINTDPEYTEVVNNRMIDGILLNDELILVFFLKSTEYYVNIFDFDLNNRLNTYHIDTITGYENEVGLFAKCINLKDYYVFFLYYTKQDNILRYKLGQFEKSGSSYTFNTNSEKSLERYTFYSNPLLNKLIKINSERCAFFAIETWALHILFSDVKVFKSLTILLIDIYDDYKNIIIRKYQLNLDSHHIHKEIDVGLFNGYIFFSSSVYNITKISENNYELASMLMIFGFPNQQEQQESITLNIYNYLSEHGNMNLFDIILKNISEDIIQNNIFEYSVRHDKVKLGEIPEQIEFYNKNNDTIKLQSGDILNKEYILKENKNNILTQGNYFFETQIIIQEPDLVTNSEESIYLKPQQLYGKILTINFILCPQDYHFDEESNQCLKEEESSETEKVEETEEKKSAEISYELCSYDDLISNNCNIGGDNNTDIYSKIANDVIKSYPDNGESVVIEADNNHIFQITTMDNELSALNNSNNSNYNLSIIDLGLCGDILKESYNITSENQSLILLKYEKISDVISEKYIQYEVYNPTTKEKMNLSLCDNISISLYVHINLEEETQQKYEELEKQGYDLFNPNDSFYQDLCTPFKSENGTDVTLSDRRNDYYKSFSNDIQCQEKCEYSNYLSNSGFLKCECNVIDDNINTEKEEKFSEKMLYESFYDILKYSNYKLVKCYNLVFNKNIFFNNKGNIIVLVYFFVFNITLILFILYGFNFLKLDLFKMIEQKKINNNKIKEKENEFELNEKKEGNPPKRKTFSLKKKGYDKNDRKDSELNKTEGEFIKKQINSKNRNRNMKYTSLILVNNQININNKIKKHSRKSIKATRTHKLPLFDKYKKDNNNNKFNITLNNVKEIEKKFDDFELNELEYIEACEYDKRNFINIYWSLLKREHLIIFTFFIRKDHNITYIKLSRFIFLLCTDMALNVFFFSDDSMHHVYKSYGKYDFLQQISQIIYSTIVTQVIEVFLCYLSMTDKHVYKIKNISDIQINKSKIFLILKCIKIKLFGFYLFTFIFFVLYWYLITAFCSVYQNTQIIFIKDSFSSFLMGLAYPFALYIFPALFRIIALKDRNKKRLKFVYFISDIIPFF